MNSMNKLAIGIDVGGTNTKYGVVTQYGEILQQGEMPTTGYDLIEDYIDAVHAAVQPLIDAVGKENIKGIGVGAPNGNVYRGTIEYAPNLAWKGIIPLTDLLEAKFHLPAALTNDANAAAVGEMIYGAAKGMKDFITITLGTGVGSGIIANGQMVYGHDGFAGELGHTVIIPNGRPHWGTQLKGSLEAYCSATGVSITARELLSQPQHQSSLLHQFSIGNITSKEVHECALQGDRTALEIFNFTGEILGRALANFVMFSSPEAIILFGGLTRAGDLILQPTRAAMEANLLPIFQNKIKILFSELRESDAAILGASALIWGSNKMEI